MTAHALSELRFERHTLSNGLRVVLHRDPALPLVAINLWYHVGSKDERPGRTGFAHLFEHMLFQGSEHVGPNEHFHYVQQAGGVANGSTWYDRTNYYETLPAHYLDRGLWLESDRMGFLLPALTEQQLATQREVVMNERRQRVDNQPYGRAFERLHELLYPPDHPYHWPVIGTLEDIAAARLDEVAAFFKTFYAPNNAVLTLAGDFSPGRALESVERYFGPIPRGPEVSPPAVALPRLDGERRAVVEDDVRLPRVYLGYRVPPLRRTPLVRRRSPGHRAGRRQVEPALRGPGLPPPDRPGRQRQRLPHRAVRHLPGGRHRPARGRPRRPRGGARRAPRPLRRHPGGRRATSSGLATCCSPATSRRSRSSTAGPTCSPSSPPASTIPGGSPPSRSATTSWAATTSSPAPRPSSAATSGRW